MADKPDSVEICFVPDGDHAGADPPAPPGATPRPATSSTRPATCWREHDGIERFTIGQRKGLGFAAGERRYVLHIVPGDNDVVSASARNCWRRAWRRPGQLAGGSTARGIAVRRRFAIGTRRRRA